MRREGGGCRGKGEDNEGRRRKRREGGGYGGKEEDKEGRWKMRREEH
jgi:hypothetical protein